MKIGKDKPYLGKLIVKVCPWKNHEFKTANKNQVYCSVNHAKTAQNARKREREYAEREVIPVSSKPGASYNLRIKEFTGVAPVKNLQPVREVLYYEKAPMRHMADLPRASYNLPDLSTGECKHGNLDYCVYCDLQ